MAYSPIGLTVTAGNAAYKQLYAVPDLFAFIGSVTAHNTGGASTLTIAVVRQSQATNILAVAVVGAAGDAQFNRGATIPLTPFILKVGEVLQVQDTTGTVQVTISGLQIS